MSNQKGILYVVATPIGNLGDITARAGRVLGTVDLILAEDTRHSRKLLDYLALRTPMKSFHDHNERQLSPDLLEKLENGENLALISDAGTPLISDPGYQLVRTAHENGIEVVPVPGPCALITALSVAGLPTDRFVFEGFAPEKQVARRKLMESLAHETRTLIFYEVPHRIMDFLEDAGDVFGDQRLASLGRELTKKYQTVYRDCLKNLFNHLQVNSGQQKGEFVVVIHGTSGSGSTENREAERILGILLNHSISVKEATAIAAEISGGKKNDLYKLALSLRDKC